MIQRCLKISLLVVWLSTVLTSLYEFKQAFELNHCHCTIRPLGSR